MRLAEVADYIQSKYGIEASYVDLAGQTLAAVTVPGANESFALLLKQDGRETVELKCGSLAKFLAAQPAFGPAVFMQDPAWIRVDLDNLALNDRFFYKTLDSAYQSSRPLQVIKNEGIDRQESSEEIENSQEHEIYLLDDEGEDFQEEVIPKRKQRPAFFKDSDFDRLLAEKGKPVIPEGIKQMQEAYDYLAVPRRESNFYRQGMLMANYEDDFAQMVPIKKQRPVYHDLTVDQLRSYFSWRTKFRQGKYKPAPPAYVYLLASELVCQIGVKDKADGLRQLRLLFAKCAEQKDISTGWQQKHILQNYLLYYGFPLEEVRPDFEDELMRGEVYHNLLSGEASGQELYQAICCLSSYLPKNNPLLKKEPEKFYELLAQVWQEVRLNPYQLLKLLVGGKTTLPVEMFADTVFFSLDPVKDAEFILGPGLVYRCQGGQWTSEIYWPSSRQRQLLANFMHEFDRLSRQAFKQGRALKEKDLPPAFKQAIVQGIADYQEILVERARPKVKINLASLDQIRADAAETKESLLTEEERQLEAEEAEKTEKNSIKISKQVSESTATEEKMTKGIDETAVSHLGLDENEEQLLLALFSGQPYQDFLRQRHLLLSVVVDQINEKIFDEIGDAVIDCDGQKAEIVEDYRSDLADLLGIEEK